MFRYIIRLLLQVSGYIGRQYNVLTNGCSQNVAVSKQVRMTRGLQQGHFDISHYLDEDPSKNFPTKKRIRHKTVGLVITNHFAAMLC